jgi:hypothetical protein
MCRYLSSLPNLPSFRQDLFRSSIVCLLKRITFSSPGAGQGALEVPYPETQLTCHGWLLLAEATRA